MTEIAVAFITVVGGGLVKGWFDSQSRHKNLLNVIERLQEDITAIKGEVIDMKEDVSEIKTVAFVNRDGIKYTQRYRLQYDMQRALALGYTNTQQLNEISILYESYRHLGGNGAVEALYNRFIELPIREDD